MQSLLTVHTAPTVLLVDDEPDIRELLSLLLTDLGYPWLAASNGQHALEIFREKRPDIVLTDIKMPGLDGIDLLGAVKTEAPETEVIMVSGHGDLELAIQSLKLDAADFITKPIDDELLEIALAKVEEKIRLRRQVREYTEHLEQLVEEKTERLVDMERRMAASQIVENFSSAMRIVSEDVADPGFFTDLPSFVAIHSADCTVLTANSLYVERFGDRTGQESEGIYRKNSVRSGRFPVEEAIATGKGFHTTDVLIAQDGSEVPVVVYTAPISNSESDTAMVLEIALDVTAVNALQAELASTQRKYEHLFNRVPCYITVQDRDLNIVEANSRFIRDFGEPRGARCFELYKHRHSPCEECPILRTFGDGEPHQTETVVTTKGDEQKNILVWTAPVLADDGAIEQVVEVSTDITQLRQLQDHVASLGIMLGSMSHGVKGLLMALDGGIYRVNSGLAKNDLARVAAGWRTVTHRLARLKKTVMDTLYYAKSRELELSEIDAFGFADDLAQGVAHKASASGIELQCDFSQADCTFTGDENALSLAFVNFLENAVDACNYDRSKGSHRIDFRAFRGEGVVRFIIRDDGTGMDRETRDNMFTLFFSSKGANGTGIGLFVSNQIVTRHGGTINVDSAVGEGTTFDISIPLTQS